jgi:hypothetical protein
VEDLNVADEMAVEECEIKVLEIVVELCGDDDRLAAGTGASVSDVQAHLSEKYEIHTDVHKAEAWLNALVDTGLLETSEDSDEFWPRGWRDGGREGGREGT